MTAYQMVIGVAVSLAVAFLGVFLCPLWVGKWEAARLPATLLFAVLVFCGFDFLLTKDNSQIAERERRWDEFHKSMQDSGCKITDFTAQKNWVYPIWRCPDGRAYLGRAQ